MWGKIGYSIYIICIHIYILWKLHRTYKTNTVPMLCHAVSFNTQYFHLRIFTLWLHANTGGKKKKRISRARCWLDVQWGGEGKQLVGKRSAAKKRCYYYSWNMHETMGDDKVELICCNFSAFSPVNLLFLVGSSPLN